MRIASWNVNGIRSVHLKGFAAWMGDLDPDIVCLQEIKASPDVLSPEVVRPQGYQSFWLPAEKRGYSGVGIYTKQEPISVVSGMGIEEYDREGRVLTLEFPKFHLVNAYFPNSQRDHARLDYKIRFCRDMLRFLQKKTETGKNVVLCGDFNIAHQEIDLRNPKANQNNAGFLPAERAWMDELLGADFVDTFRELHPEPHRYTWWSYRPTIRERNIGWRLDYFVTNTDFFDRVRDSDHLDSVLGSDHCPILLTIKE